MFETVNDFQASLSNLTTKNEACFKAAFEHQKQLTPRYSGHCAQQGRRAP